MKTHSQVKPRSAFAKIIAETYFIPGITGRAMCLQDHHEPNRASSCIDHAKDSPLQSRSIDGLCPEPNPSAWDIERHHERRMRKEHQIVSWVESPSFLMQRASNRCSSTARTTATYSLSNSERTMQTTQSRTTQSTMQTSQSRTTQDDDRSEDIRSAKRREKPLLVASTGVRPSFAVHDESSNYERGATHSSIRRQHHAEERQSTHPPRLATDDLLQGNGWIALNMTGSRPAGPIRASSTRSGCRYKGRKPSTSSISLKDGPTCSHCTLTLGCNSTLGSIPEIPGGTPQRPTLPVRAMSTQSCRPSSSFREGQRRGRRRRGHDGVAGGEHDKQQQQHPQKRHDKIRDNHHHLSDERSPLVVNNVKVRRMKKRLPPCDPPAA